MKSSREISPGFVEISGNLSVPSWRPLLGLPYGQTWHVCLNDRSSPATREAFDYSARSAFRQDRRQAARRAAQSARSSDSRYPVSVKPRRLTVPVRGQVAAQPTSGHHVLGALALSAAALAAIAGIVVRFGDGLSVPPRSMDEPDFSSVKVRSSRVIEQRTFAKANDEAATRRQHDAKPATGAHVQKPALAPRRELTLRSKLATVDRHASGRKAHVRATLVKRKPRAGYAVPLSHSARARAEPAVAHAHVARSASELATAGSVPPGIDDGLAGRATAWPERGAFVSSGVGPSGSPAADDFDHASIPAPLFGVALHRAFEAAADGRTEQVRNGEAEPGVAATQADHVTGRESIGQSGPIVAGRQTSAWETRARAVIASAADAPNYGVPLSRGARDAGAEDPVTEALVPAETASGFDGLQTHRRVTEAPGFPQ